jgi:hypothetical protein
MSEVLKQAHQLLLTEPHAPTVCDQLEVIFRQAIAELESQEPVCPDCKAKVLYECVACSSNNYPPQLEQNFCPRCGKRTNDIHTCTPPQRKEQEPVQVSPLECVEMVMDKEHLIGKPIFWAEWPNQEKNA